MSKVVCRALVEIMGKPKEHVESSLKGYLDKLQKDDNYAIINLEFLEGKKQEENDLWVAFAEIEFSTEKVDNIVSFCFDYMPSVIEIVEPKSIILKDSEFSHVLNDLQARLHQVDMIAKQLNMRNQILQKNMAGLLRNYLLVLLGKSDLNLEQLSKLTGVTKEKLGDYLDKLIDEGKVDLTGEIYVIKKSSGEIA